MLNVTRLHLQLIDARFFAQECNCQGGSCLSDFPLSVAISCKNLMSAVMHFSDKHNLEIPEFRHYES